MSSDKAQNPIIFITWASWCGKTKMLMELTNLWISSFEILTQHTTRDPRPSDTNMKYRDPDVFKLMINNGQFLLIDGDEKYAISKYESLQALQSWKIPIAIIGRYEVETIDQFSGRLITNNISGVSHNIVNILVSYGSYNYDIYLERVKMRGDNPDPLLPLNIDRHNWNERIIAEKFWNPKRRGMHINYEIISNNSFEEQITNIFAKLIKV